MSKLLKEFKEFAMRGNVVDMAVGVIIGAAFGKVVTAVIDIFLTPILDALPIVNESGGTGFLGALVSLLGVVVNFILTALVLFLIVKVVNKARNATKKPEPPKEEPRKCPYCLTEVDKKATRCPHCTSDIEGK